MSPERGAAWRIVVPALLLGMVAGFGTTRMWIRRAALPPQLGASPGPTASDPSPRARAPLPAPVAREIRGGVLELVAHSTERRKLRTGLGFEGPYLMSTDLTTRLIASEIDDVVLAESVWNSVRKKIEVPDLPIADQALVSILLGQRYLGLAQLVAFKRSAPGWLEGPDLGREQATFFEREIQETQGARAMQCLGELVDVSLAVFTGEPADSREGGAALETLLSFFDVSRAVATYAWTPGYESRVSQLQGRIERTLTTRASAGDGPGAAIARLAWLAWRSGRTDLTGDLTELKMELREAVDRLRTSGLSLPEPRFRALFPYAYPGTDRAIPGPEVPYPPH